MGERAELPAKGRPRDEVLAAMREQKRADADWRGGRTFSLVYAAGEDVDALLEDAAALYAHENALNPARFPSLRRMERDIVQATCGLLGGDGASSGALTLGGTESILMAVLAARERARVERGVESGNLVCPRSAHPAFAKAAHYLGLERRAAALGADLRADPAEVGRLVDDRTVLIVGSAPCYPFGVVDPIPELAALAGERGISFHTDACVGGFMLPFLESQGVDVPAFDFRVPGVTTISADVHKYGYATKGVSVIAHRSRQTLHDHQLFRFDDWPGGSYGSLGLAGTRPSAPIAAAWAVMQHLGFEGYERLARVTLETTRALQDGIRSIPGLRIVGAPDMTLFAIAGDDLDVFAVGDRMDERGWHLDRQHQPDALHLIVSPHHARILEPLLADLRAAAADPGATAQRSARYS